MKRSWLIFLALIGGLIWGMAWSRSGVAGLASAIEVASTIGGMWLDGLRMTIVPFVVSLLITGIAKTIESTHGDRVALRAVITFLLLLWVSTAIAAFLIPGLLAVWPIPTEAAQTLSASLPSAPQAAVPSAGLGAFLRSVIPANPLAAAVEESLLPLILFVSLFAVALSRLPVEQREPVTRFFDAVSSALLLIVQWVLVLAPLGVAALGFAVGANAGTSAIGGLAHYIAIVSCAGLAAMSLAYPVAILGGGLRLRDFVREIVPAQAVALSTQSSLASLPSMLRSCDALGVNAGTARISLPLAVAIFRVTSPAMNLGVAIYVAHWMGLTLSPAAIMAGAIVAGITTVGSISLPGQVSFLTSIVPICVAMDVPIEPLALLVAVEMIPDLVRTVGNVTMDVAATSMIARQSAIHETNPPDPVMPGVSEEVQA